MFCFFLWSHTFIGISFIPILTLIPYIHRHFIYSHSYFDPIHWTLIFFTSSFDHIHSWDISMSPFLLLIPYIYGKFIGLPSSFDPIHAWAFICSPSSFHPLHSWNILMGPFFLWSHTYLHSWDVHISPPGHKKLPHLCRIAQTIWNGWAV